MRVEQFVIAYKVDQDRIRCMLPEGFTSLRPVLRINTEIREEGTENERVYVEFNTPVEGPDHKGWLNIAHWEGAEDGLGFQREGQTVKIQAPFLNLSYTAAGVKGGCPAERDNDGTYYLGGDPDFCPAEKITERKEYCDAEFKWEFDGKGARGRSIRRILPAYFQEVANHYQERELSAENAGVIDCDRVLGTYFVVFER